VRVIIEDDGRGFEMPPPRELAHSGHLGLLGMQERAQLIGGQLEIQSSPGRGSRVILQFQPS
jgi:signal transduction histidine kinase